MKTVSTRELLTNHKALQSRLSAGESIAWTSRGKVIAQLIPPNLPEERKANRPDWVSRARASGAISSGQKSVSDWISDDRGE